MGKTGQWWLTLCIQCLELVLLLFYSYWVLPDILNSYDSLNGSFTVWIQVFTELVALSRISVKLIPSVLIALVSYHQQIQCRVPIIDVSGDPAVADLVSFEIMEIFESTLITFEAQSSALFKTKSVCNAMGLDYRICTAEIGLLYPRGMVR
jgi:hypothetical protein